MPNLETLVLWRFIRWETRIVRCRLVGKVSGRVRAMTIKKERPVTTAALTLCLCGHAGPLAFARACVTSLENVAHSRRLILILTLMRSSRAMTGERRRGSMVLMAGTLVPMAGTLVLTARIFLVRPFPATGRSRSTHNVPAVQFAAHSFQVDAGESLLMLIGMGAPGVPSFHQGQKIEGGIKLVCQARGVEQFDDPLLQTGRGGGVGARHPRTGDLRLAEFGDLVDQRAERSQRLFPREGGRIVFQH